MEYSPGRTIPHRYNSPYDFLVVMTDHNVNDIHGFNIGFQQAMRRLETAEISDYNKDLDKLNEAALSMVNR
jgi:hypothetical protein